MANRTGNPPLAVCGPCHRVTAAEPVWGGDSTLTPGLILALFLAQAPLGPRSFSDSGVAEGRLTVIAPEQLSGLEQRVRTIAMAPTDWLGLGRVVLTPLTIVLVPDARGFGEWTRGRIPGWGAGMSIPGRRLVVIRVDAGDPIQTLRHELAHIAFHTRIRARVPIWFSEGYAALASGEHGRLDALQLNLAVALGHLPELAQLDAALRGSVGDAAPGYALAAEAVASVARRHPSGSLQPMLNRLAAGEDFDSALLASTGLDRTDFAVAWHHDMATRYNLLIWLGAGGAWLLVLLVLGALRSERRRRDAPRRAALDEDWSLPPPDQQLPAPDNDSMTSGLPLQDCLDRHGPVG